MSQSAAETLYTWRCLWTDVLQWQRPNVVSAPLYRDGALVAPTSGTFTLRNPTGTNVVDAAAVTVSSSIATYTVLAASLPSTVTLGEGWMETWALLVSGVTYTTDRPAAVCRVPLTNPITDADLYLEHPDLAAWRPQAETSYQKPIDASWAELMGRLSAEGRLSYIMKPSAAFRQWMLYTTLARVFINWSKSQARGNWLELAKLYQTKADAEWGRITVQLDRDQDGVIDDLSRRTGGFGVLNINAPVGHRPFRGT